MFSCTDLNQEKNAQWSKFKDPRPKIIRVLQPLLDIATPCPRSSIVQAHPLRSSETTARAWALIILTLDAWAVHVASMVLIVGYLFQLIASYVFLEKKCCGIHICIYGVIIYYNYVIIYT